MKPIDNETPTVVAAMSNHEHHYYYETVVPVYWHLIQKHTSEKAYTVSGKKPDSYISERRTEQLG